MDRTEEKTFVDKQHFAANLPSQLLIRQKQALDKIGNIRKVNNLIPISVKTLYGTEEREIWRKINTAVLLFAYGGAKPQQPY